MQSAGWSAVFILVAGLSCVAVFVKPAFAASAFPWCSPVRVNESGTISCGFSSYEQCMAAATVGVCTQNPFYTGPASSQPQTAVRHRRPAR
jgi:hypothetical protein